MTTINQSLNLISNEYDVEHEVRRRYAEGSRQVEIDLCCPIQYDQKYLDVLPQEIVEKDYGCGDPSIYVNKGETVVDLGSGAGKICYILSQKVGHEGKVIGVDFNDAMLCLARKYKDEMAIRIGYRNVDFIKARIQDLALNLDLAQKWIAAHPIHRIETLSLFESECDRLRKESPAIPSESVDIVVSNCVLNLVRSEDKIRLFQEIYRVLKRGGRAVISDIVCDENPTEEIRNDPKLWSGCIAGALREDSFLKSFENAGFYGVEILQYQTSPWQVIDGVEFRSMTVRAFKGKEGPCLERNHAVIYKGPWKCVTDDDGHTLFRGNRMAVCDKTFSILTDSAGPYSDQVIPVNPHESVPFDEALPFDCKRTTQRHPRETKGDHKETILSHENPCDCDSGKC